MQVSEVMSSGVLSAAPGDSVRSVVIHMLSRHCGAIPVIEPDARIVGIVSVRDIMLPMYPKLGEYIHDNVGTRDFLAMEEGYDRVLAMRVDQVMTRNPLVLSPETPVLEAASWMGVKNFRRMPVARDGKLVGMVSIGDINRGLFFARIGG